MDELELWDMLEKHGVVLVETEDGVVLGIKRQMLDKLIELAANDEDEAVFIVIDDKESAKDKVLN